MAFQQCSVGKKGLKVCLEHQNLVWTSPAATLWFDLGLRGALLHTFIVLCAYFRHHGLPISWKQLKAYLSPYLWHQHIIFTHRTAADWIFSCLFFCFWTIFSKIERCLCGKTPLNQQFLKYSDQPVCFLVPDRLVYAKLLKSLSSPFWSQFGLQQVILTMSLFLNTLNCCPVIGWFAICINIQWVHMNRWIEYWRTDCLCHCLCNAGL